MTRDLREDLGLNKFLTVKLPDGWGEEPNEDALDWGPAEHEPEILGAIITAYVARVGIIFLVNISDRQ